MDRYYKGLLDNNRTWVANKLEGDAQFFEKMIDGQAPPILWSGCSDSRVPANEIIGAEPGEVFVHRNIANMVLHTDISMLSVLDYAVNVLKVKHVIVCGHYGCGGVKAAMGNAHIGIIDNWIRHIKDVYRFHADELNQIKDVGLRFDRFVELNVWEQVQDLAKTSIIQKAWNSKQDVQIHGWVYGLHDGLIKDLEITLLDDDSLPEMDQLYMEGSNNRKQH